MKYNADVGIHTHDHLLTGHSGVCLGEVSILPKQA